AQHPFAFEDLAAGGVHPFQLGPAQLREIDHRPPDRAHTSYDRSPVEPASGIAASQARGRGAPARGASSPIRRRVQPTTSFMTAPSASSKASTIASIVLRDAGLLRSTLVSPMIERSGMRTRRTRSRTSTVGAASAAPYTATKRRSSGISM